MLSFDELRLQFEDFLQSKKFDKNPQGLYEPLNYILALGGKRIRPALLLASYNLFRDDVQIAMPLAFATELFHNFTLMHDDIMDEADLRRGETSVHKKYDVNTAILSGDVMMIYAYQYMAMSPPDKLAQVLDVFHDTAIKVCEGQQWDVEYETSIDVKVPDYIKMISYKTAVLVAATLKIGAIIAGASDKDADHLYQFGENLGIAFQVQDDILDTFGDTAKVGKVIGGDILQSKKTYLYLKAVELIEDHKRADFIKLYNSDIQQEFDKVKKVRKVFDELYVLHYAQQLKENYEQLAKSHFDAVTVKEKRRSTINEIVDMLMVRES